MTGMVILDVVIGVVFVYLLLSLLCTAINEWIASLFSLRAKNLRTGITQLLGDPLLQKLVYEHPLIASMREDKAGVLSRVWNWIAQLWRRAETAEKALRDPSYLPTSGFARTVFDLFLEKDGKTGAYTVSAKLKDKDAFRAELERIFGSKYHETIKRICGVDVSDPTRDAAALAEQIREKIAGHLDSAIRALTGSEVLSADAVEGRLGEWFDSSMDRVSGWYKRRIEKIAFGVGLVVALAFNASTTTMISALAHDQNLRGKLAAAGTTVGQKCDLEKLKDGKDPVCGIYFEGLKAGKDATPLPLGWYERYFPWKANGGLDLGAVGNWVLWLLGIIATGFAASLGAPFWFEILQKVAKIRSSGNKPKERAEKPAK